MADFDHITADGTTKYVKDSTARAGLADKVDKVTGKGLSEEDFTSTLKTKLDSIEAGAEVNVQTDWSQSDTTADDFIKNKPDLTPLPYLENVAWYDEAHEFDPSGSYQKGNTCIYNEKLYRCDVNQATQGSFVPLEWSEVNARTLSGDYSNLWDIADQLYTGKQDKLTAGANVSIDANNEISATDTKPSEITRVETGSETLLHNAWKQIKTFNLSKGLYIIHAGVVFQGVNSTGIRAFTISTTSAATGGGINTTRAPASSNDTNIHMTLLWEVTANTQTFYINAYQNAGTNVTLTAQPRFEYIKLR